MYITVQQHKIMIITEHIIILIKIMNCLSDFFLSFFLFHMKKKNAHRFRSRSVTPSSHPGTPPQHQPNDLLTGSNFSTSLANSLTSGQIKPEFATARTYSDQLRNFAAKYNALNEYV